MGGWGLIFAFLNGMIFFFRMKEMFFHEGVIIFVFGVREIEKARKCGLPISRWDFATTEAP